MHFSTLSLFLPYCSPFQIFDRHLLIYIIEYNCSQVSLEAANREISSLKSHVIEADSLIAEAEGKAERNAAKTMEKEFQLAQETLIAEREALASALEDLRVHVSRQGNEASLTSMSQEFTSPGKVTRPV